MSTIYNSMSETRAGILIIVNLLLLSPVRRPQCVVRQGSTLRNTTLWIEQRSAQVFSLASQKKGEKMKFLPSKEASNDVFHGVNRLWWFLLILFFPDRGRNSGAFVHIIPFIRVREKEREYFSLHLIVEPFCRTVGRVNPCLTRPVYQPTMSAELCDPWGIYDRILKMILRTEKRERSETSISFPCFPCITFPTKKEDG